MTTTSAFVTTRETVDSAIAARWDAAQNKVRETIRTAYRGVLADVHANYTMNGDVGVMLAARAPRNFVWRANGEHLIDLWASRTDLYRGLSQWLVADDTIRRGVEPCFDDTCTYCHQPRG